MLTKATRMKKVTAALLALVLALTCLGALSAGAETENRAPDYSQEESWAYYSVGADKDADLFLICPTVDVNDEFNMPSFGKTNPLLSSHFDEFVACYADGDLSARRETWSPENPNGRWRRYTYDEILARDKTSLDITWIKSSSGTEDVTLSELLTQIKVKSASIAQAVAALEELIGEVDE